LSVVPIGPPLIWIPSALWLFHEGSIGWGVFMLAWGLGVSSIDNVVKPWLISQGSDMPFLLIFFGVLRGALAFGFIGVFLGPTLLAVGYRLITEWTAGTATTSIGETQPETMSMTAQNWKFYEKHVARLPGPPA
jgi:predicted PurR-regulated permease PerM